MPNVDDIQTAGNNSRIVEGEVDSIALQQEANSIIRGVVRRTPLPPEAGRHTAREVVGTR